MERQLESKGPVAAILRYVSSLRFPWLLGFVALIFGLDVIFPDLLPFVDELLLGLLTLVLAAWRKRKNTITSTIEGKVVD
jgi:hypothetical protein